MCKCINVCVCVCVWGGGGVREGGGDIYTFLTKQVYHGQFRITLKRLTHSVKGLSISFEFSPDYSVDNTIVLSSTCVCIYFVTFTMNGAMAVAYIETNKGIRAFTIAILHQQFLYSYRC